MRCLLTVLPLILLGCSGASSDVDGRDAVLIEWLQRDNALWLGRDPALLTGKYDRMAESPYDFMRGTAGLFHEDLRRLSLDPVERGADLGLVATPDAASVLILGDPHPENLSTFYADDAPGPIVGEASPELTVAWADLDAAGPGPWLADLRRGAQGLLLFVQDMEGCDDSCQIATITAFAAGYDEGVRAVADGGPTIFLEGDLRGNPFVGDLLAEATEEGAERNRLRGNTEQTEAGRRFEVLATLPETGRGLLAPTGRERVIAERILAAYAENDGRPFRVLDVARRYGQGVSSFPATRFVILWDEGDDGPDDDRLLNAREVLDPPVYAGPGRPAAATFRSNGERVLTTSRVLWPRPDLDPRVGYADDGLASYKLLSWGSWYQGLDHGKAADVWNDGDATLADLEALGRGIGAALAFAHCRGTTASGEPACPEIRADLGEDPAMLPTALPPVSLRDRDRALDDHARFLRLREAHGPLLGADIYAEVAP